MKKAFILSLIAFTTSVAQSFGAGHIYISNYYSAPYNQVLWGFGPNLNQAVLSPVQIQIWYGEGVIADPNLLTLGLITAIDPAITYDNGYGPGGFFQGGIQELATWVPGDIFTFQLRAPGFLGSASILWTEQAAIANRNGPAPFAQTVPRLILVPEPSACALIGLGIGGFLTLRRRR